MSNFPKITEAMRLAEQEFAIGNNEEGRKILTDCLKLLHDDGADIWQGKNLTSELGTLFDLLTEYGSADELLFLLKDLILDHLTDDWRVANFLMGLLQTKLADADKVTIVKTVKGHIEYLIRSNGIFKKKYEWLGSEGEEMDADAQLTRFLTWLLNHPYASVQSAVIDAIQWLAKVRADVLLPVLIENSLNSRLERSDELSARLLAAISAIQPDAVWFALEKTESLQNRFSSIQNIMIRIYWRETLMACSSLNSNAHALYEQFAAQFPAGKVEGADIYLDEIALKPVDNIIENLNYLEILNRAFCERLLANVKELSQPLTAVDQLRAEKYVRRSFYDEDIVIGHYTYILRSAIGNALYDRVGEEQINEVKTILELPVL